MSYLLDVMKAAVFRWAERAQIIRPTLVGTCDIPVTWPDDLDGVDSTEVISFFLLQYPSGSRDYRFHSYGMCAELEYHDKYMRDILVWVYGGATPPGFKKGGVATEVIQVVKG